MPAACDAIDELEAALTGVPALAGRQQVSPLPGGLTNHNYRVTTPDGDYVARVASASSALMGIDRAAEHRNAQLAAGVGAGPRVVAYRPGLLVIDWLDGRTLTSRDLREPAVLDRVVTVVRRLHAAPRFRGEFDMFAIQRRYLTLVRARGFRLPPRYLDYVERAEQVARALAVRPVARVSCHNDLLASNFIDDGARVWIIDYEYAGNNDPAFELGNLWSEAALPVDALPAIVGRYHGRVTNADLARARLWGLAAQYAWTLWASIQDAQSDIEFDFWTWGMAKYDRAVAEFDGPDLPALLTDVTS